MTILNVQLIYFLFIHSFDHFLNVRTNVRRFSSSSHPFERPHLNQAADPTNNFVPINLMSWENMTFDI